MHVGNTRKLLSVAAVETSRAPQTHLFELKCSLKPSGFDCETQRDYNSNECKLLCSARQICCFRESQFLIKQLLIMQ